MKSKIIIAINFIGVLVVCYWYYQSKDLEPLVGIIIGIGTLIGLIWKERIDSSNNDKQVVKIKKNKNSPVSGKVDNQTNNYFNSDPELVKKLDALNKKIENLGKEDEKKNINVTSHNQSGGINAYKVNIGVQQRQLNQDARNQLMDLLNGKSDQTITVTAVMGDGEAFSYANQIKDFLSSNGFQIKGVDQAVYSKPVMGQIFNPDKLELIIGTKQ
jgi:hypothetical protein